MTELLALLGGVYGINVGFSDNKDSQQQLGNFATDVFSQIGIAANTIGTDAKILDKGSALQKYLTTALEQTVSFTKEMKSECNRNCCNSQQAYRTIRIGYTGSTLALANPDLQLAGTSVTSVPATLVKIRDTLLNRVKELEKCCPRNAWCC